MKHLCEIIEHKIVGRQGVNKFGSCQKPSDEHSSKDGAYGKSRTTLRHRLETKFPDPAFNMQGTLQNVAEAMGKITAELPPQQQYAEFASDKA